MSRLIAIIPARGGSKRIPKKNIKDFDGLPLIVYSIKIALASKLFSKVIVSTDDEEIKNVALEYGAEVPFLRPLEISDDYSGTGVVVSHALKFLKDNGEEFDYCCTIYATAPLLQEKYLIEGFEKLKNCDAKYAFSCTSMPFPIQRTFKIDENSRCEMFEKENFSKRSQDLEEAYQDAGQFYWSNLNQESKNIMFGEDSIAIILPRYLVQDIDTLEDFKRAEYMYQIIKKDCFEECNILKKKDEKIKFSQGNIYFMIEDQYLENEQCEKKDLFLKPVLVYKKLSSETFIGIPLTSKQKVGNSYFTFTYSSKNLSTALLNQIRVFDLKRAMSYAGFINVKDFTKLRDKVNDFMDITLK